MDKMNIETARSIDNYFSVLSNFGYVNYNHVDKLLVLVFINDIINGMFGNIVSEDEYKILNKCLCCIYGTSCLFPYPKYLVTSELPKNYISKYFRVTEDSILRFTAQDTMRSQ